MSFETIAGESKSVTEERITPCTKTILPTILSRYPLENILNVDEFVLFYQCLPSKTLYLKGDKCSWGEHSKVRPTGLAAGNALGERLHLCLSLAKLKKPDVLKELNICLVDKCSTQKLDVNRTI